MSGDVIDMHRWRFTHERHPARKLSDRESYLRALSRQKVEAETRGLRRDEAQRLIDDNDELNRMIGAPEYFGPGDAA